MIVVHSSKVISDSGKGFCWLFETAILGTVSEAVCSSVEGSSPCK